MSRPPEEPTARGIRATESLLQLSVLGSWTRAGYLARRTLRHFAEEDAALATVARSGAPPLAVITGASSGIGFATAEALARRGYRLVLVSRDATRNASAVASLQRARAAHPGDETDVEGRAAIEGRTADLSDLGAVRRLGEELLEHHERIDLLVHNAGVLHRHFHRTDQGFEATFALHVLAPHLLTTLLRPALLAAGRSGGARIITVSSGGMYAVPLDLDRLEFSLPTHYRGATAYALAKRAQVELTVEWARRLRGSGIVPLAVDPGWVRTEVVRQGLPRFARIAWPVLRTPAEGADTVVWCAISPAVLGQAGSFFLDRYPRRRHPLPGTRAHGWQRREAFERVSELVGVQPWPPGGRS